MEAAKQIEYRYFAIAGVEPWGGDIDSCAKPFSSEKEAIEHAKIIINYD